MSSISTALLHRITTPEQVEFGYELAGLSTRAMAWLADQVVLWILRIAIAVSFAGGGGEIGFAATMVGVFVVDFGYYTFFELYKGGRSPGKVMLKLRVVSARGSRLSFADVFIRNLLRPLDTLPIMMGIGGIAAFIDPLHRRLGDIVADTIVVRDVCRELPAALLTHQRRANSYQADPAIRQRIEARVTRAQRDVVYDLVMRRDTLDEAVREQLFAHAADHLRRRCNLPRESDYLSDEQVVVNVALVLQAGSAAMGTLGGAPRSRA